VFKAWCVTFLMWSRTESERFFERPDQNAGNSSPAVACADSADGDWVALRIEGKTETGSAFPVSLRYRESDLMTMLLFDRPSSRPCTRATPPRAGAVKDDDRGISPPFAGARVWHEHYDCRTSGTVDA
jgi:hypothetical protein